MEYLIVPTIASAVYAIIEIIKAATKDSEKFKRFIPLVALGLGAIAGVICYFFIPTLVVADNVVLAIIIGAASGLSSVGVNQVIKQITKGEENK